MSGRDINGDGFARFSLQNTTPETQRIMDAFNKRVTDIYVRFMAARIHAARLEQAKREGRYRGGERRKRGVGR